MKNWSRALEKYGISRNRCGELLAFCRQYPEKKRALSDLLGVGAQNYSDMPHGSDVTDTVYRSVARREWLRKDCDLIEQTAESIEGGIWRAALLTNICYNVAYEKIDSVLMPTARRESYFKARRQFLIILHEKLMERREIEN